MKRKAPETFCSCCLAAIPIKDAFFFTAPTGDKKRKDYFCEKCLSGKCEKVPACGVFKHLWRELQVGNTDLVKKVLALHRRYFMPHLVHAAFLGMFDASVNIERHAEYFKDKTDKGAAYRNEYNRFKEKQSIQITERKPIFGLMVRYRPYRCTVCGFEMDLSTNHTGSCSAICPGCSWMPSFGEGHSIPALGSHTYRTFEYCGPEPTDFNPEAPQPEEQ